jgi:hypothetical protein
VIKDWLPVMIAAALIVGVGVLLMLDWRRDRKAKTSAPSAQRTFSKPSTESLADALPPPKPLPKPSPAARLRVPPPPPPSSTKEHDPWDDDEPTRFHFPEDKT